MYDDTNYRVLFYLTGHDRPHYNGYQSSSLSSSPMGNILREYNHLVFSKTLQKYVTTTWLNTILYMCLNYYTFSAPHGKVSQSENNNEVRLNLYQIKPDLRSGNIHLAIELNTLSETTLLEILHSFIM